jgi:hypothetical protein
VAEEWSEEKIISFYSIKMKFAIVCILFVLAALTYFRLHHQINIEADVVGTEKKQQLKNVKQMLQWVMVGLGLLVILCGYDLLYVPGADKYLGKKCGSCSSGPSMKSLPRLQEFSGMMGVSDLPDF